VDDLATGDKVAVHSAAITEDERLDTSFGSDGRMTMLAGNDLDVTASALRTNGQTLLSLTHYIDTAPTPPFNISLRMFPSWYVARTSNNGRVDPDWNGGAARNLNADLGALSSYGGDVLPIGSDKTFAVGTIQKDEHTRGVLARLDKYGKPDTTFGSGGFVTFAPPSGFTATSWTWIEPDHSGHYMLGGVAWKGGEPYATGATPYYLIARVGASGALDHGYSSDGYYTHALGSSFGKLFFTISDFVDDAVFVASQGDGRVYAVYFGANNTLVTPWGNGAGYITVPSFGNWRPTITGFTNDGYRLFASVTPAFGMIEIDPTNGHIEGTLEYGGAWTVPGLTDVQARSIAFMRGTRRILMVGDGKDSAGKRRLVVLDADGARHRDHSFHQDGIAITSFTTELHDAINAVSVAANDTKFVATVSDYRNGLGLARYNVAVGGLNQPCHFTSWDVPTTCNGNLQCRDQWVCLEPPPPEPVPTPDPPPPPPPGTLGQPCKHDSWGYYCEDDLNVACKEGTCQPRETGDPCSRSAQCPGGGTCFVGNFTSTCVDVPACNEWVYLETTGCGGFSGICAGGCGEDHDAAEEMAKAQLRVQTCLGSGAGCCGTEEVDTCN
jgi:hypothetical protein